ncbi:MAG: hypothetical protein LBL39_03420 [Planctomycetaceae bacterium]|nr:hypothetical protein [Planctomycetaceae bacterium]
MFTFNFIEVLIIFIAAFVLLGGLVVFSIRRRSEILQEILTPEEPNLADEFFKKRPVIEEAPIDAPPVEQQSDEETIGGWGTPATEEQPQ